MLPPADTMYEAVALRDASFEGVFVVAVKTTGVFCRPGCTAKVPRRENVEFFAGAAEALHAGYRACLRCRPLEVAGAWPAWGRGLLVEIDRAPDRRWNNHDLRARGVEPGRVARLFKSRFGMTFQGYCRARRVGRAVAHLRRGGSTNGAAAVAGFESESGFRDAFKRLFDATPTGARRSEVITIAWVRSPIGPLLAGAVEEGVCLLEFVDRRAIEHQIETMKRRFGAGAAPGNHRHLDTLERELDAYFAGRLRRFTVPLSVRGTEFQVKVWGALRRIPHGETRSYAQIAREVGRPSAVRAVARANGDNRIGILIPCHRVIGSDGTLTGYGGGLWRKAKLLEIEAGGNSVRTEAASNGRADLRGPHPPER